MRIGNGAAFAAPPSALAVAVALPPALGYLIWLLTGHEPDHPGLLVKVATVVLAAGIFALLSLTGAYRAPRIVRAEVLLPADSTRNQAF